VRTRATAQQRSKIDIRDAGLLSQYCRRATFAQLCAIFACTRTAFSPGQCSTQGTESRISEETVQPVPSARQIPETSRPLTNAARVNASPQPKANSFSDYTIQLQAVVGVGTIIGLAGATVGVNLGERINVGGGMGANLLGLPSRASILILS
jgi:hypothetical protein